MRELMELAARQHGVLTAQQLRDHGVGRDASRRLIERGGLRRPRRGIYLVAGAPDSWRQRLSVAVLAAGDEAAASHQSAACLLKVPGFDEGPVVVTVRGHRSIRNVPGLVHESKKLFPEHLTVVDGIAVTRPARLCFDLCQTLGDVRAGRVIDHLLNRNLVGPADLELVLAALARRGRTGTARFRRLLDARGEGFVPSESELEDLCLAVLAAAGIGAPSRQVAVGDEVPIGRVDLLFPSARLILEVDSRTWHDGWSATVEDRRRDARLMAAGWIVLRVTYWQLTHEPAEFTSNLKAILARQAA